MRQLFHGIVNHKLAPILPCILTAKNGISVHCNAVIDTGCTGLAISHELADRLLFHSLPKVGASTINHGGGWTNVHHFHVDVTIGPFKPSDQHFTVSDMITWPSVVHGGDALIGMEYLIHFDLLFNGSRMTFEIGKDF